MNNQFLQKLKTAAKHFKAIAVVFLVIVLICYAIYAFFRFNYISNRDTALEKINSTVLTLADVMGTNLPKMPDEELNNSTIGGIDANNNTIRDDVELTIFEKYPDSAKMRAALLQYAQALQLELTAVNSEEVMKVFLEKNSSAYSCIADALKSQIDINNWQNFSSVWDEKDRELKDLVLNTGMRKNHYNGIYDRYMVSSASPDRDCDIDLSTLSD
jgi:hypothetical protein